MMSVGISTAGINVERGKVLGAIFVDMMTVEDLDSTSTWRVRDWICASKKLQCKHRHYVTLPDVTGP